VDLAASDKTSQARAFFEVWNTEPGMNNLGGRRQAVHRAKIWDPGAFLEERLMYATAVDDCHQFLRKFIGSREREVLCPIQAKALDHGARCLSCRFKAIIEAMNRGDFYATTGVCGLASYEVTGYHSNGIGLDDRTHDLGWSLPGAKPAALPNGIYRQGWRGV